MPAWDLRFNGKSWRDMPGIDPVCKKMNFYLFRRGMLALQEVAQSGLPVRWAARVRDRSIKLARYRRAEAQAERSWSLNPYRRDLASPAPCEDTMKKERTSKVKEKAKPKPKPKAEPTSDEGVGAPDRRVRRVMHPLQLELAARFAKLPKTRYPLKRKWARLSGLKNGSTTVQDLLWFRRVLHRGTLEKWKRGLERLEAEIASPSESEGESDRSGPVAGSMEAEADNKDS